jgi:hypothetical protein
VIDASLQLQRSRLTSKAGAARYRALEDLQNQAIRDADLAAHRQASIALYTYRERRRALGMLPQPGDNRSALEAVRDFTLGPDHETRKMSDTQNPNAPSGG